MKNTLRRFLLTLLLTISGAALAGNLKVNLAPTQAVSAGAQWRVDGGVWRNSGDNLDVWEITVALDPAP